MEKTPKSLRLHIALFGRTNAGKSSFLNLISGQETAITSPLPGTTTDAVEKTMELLPIGPVMFIDTAGLEDNTILGDERIKRSLKAFDRADVVILVCNAGVLGEAENTVLAKAAERSTPVIAAVTKSDLLPPDDNFSAELLKRGVKSVISVSGTDFANREKYLAELKKALIDVLPDDFIAPPPLLGDLLHPGSLVMLIVPIDIEAPKGRLILPQVQTIRDALDQDSIVMAVKTSEYKHALSMLKTPPDLVICDSQVVHFMVKETPPEIPCTTFSILFSRLKGDMDQLTAGARQIPLLKDGDKVLIAEGCTHHAMDDDIGRVKIPRWLKEFTKAELVFDVYSGRDYPENLSEYKLIVHCGGCMLNRREVLSRIQAAAQAGVPITNYGMCISCTQKVLDKVLTPFKTPENNCC